MLFRSIYFTKYANEQSGTGSSTASNVETSSGKTSAKDYANIFLNRKKQKGISQTYVSDSNILGELNKYRETKWESRLTNEKMTDLNLLTWWKEHEHILSIMARDLLTPPTSIVASESAFSASGRVLEERRSRLSPDMLDGLGPCTIWNSEPSRLDRKSVV